MQSIDSALCYTNKIISITIIMFIDSTPANSINFTANFGNTSDPSSLNLLMYSIATAYLNRQLINHRTAESTAKISPNWAQLL